MLRFFECDACERRRFLDLMYAYLFHFCGPLLGFGVLPLTELGQVRLGRRPGGSGGDFIAIANRDPHVRRVFSALPKIARDGEGPLALSNDNEEALQFRFPREEPTLLRRRQPGNRFIGQQDADVRLRHSLDN